MKNFFLFVGFLLVFSLAFASVAQAVEPIGDKVEKALGITDFFGLDVIGDATGSGLVGTLVAVTNWVFVAFLLIAVIFVILAAFQFLTGGGSAEQVAQARQKLIWAAVAIIVAALSRTIPFAISNIFGAPGGAS